MAKNTNTSSDSNKKYTNYRAKGTGIQLTVVETLKDDKTVDYTMIEITASKRDKETKEYSDRALYAEDLLTIASLAQQAHADFGISINATGK